jgi:hypothetical protein
VQSISNATASLGSKDLSNALNLANLAARLNPEGSEAKSLLPKIHLSQDLLGGEEALNRGDYKNAAQQYQDAANLAQASDDSNSQKEAQAGLTCAQKLSAASDAKRDFSRIDEEINLLTEVTQLKSVLGLKEWVNDAKKRKKEGAAVAEIKLALSDGDRAVEGANYETAETKYESADKQAKALQKTDEQAEAEAGIRCLQYLRDAQKAKNVDEEVNQLAEAARLKPTISNIKTLLDEATKRRDKDHVAAINEQAWREALSKGTNALERGNYSEASKQFAEAGNLKGADAGLKCAKALVAADEAKNKGDLNEEIKNLRQATNFAMPRGVFERLETAVARQGLRDVLAKAEDLLKSDSDYSKAAPQFEDALGRAKKLSDRDAQAKAESGKACAEALGQADLAVKRGQPDDEIKSLQQAATARADNQLAKHRLEQAQSNQEKYNTALRDAQTAFAGHDYKTTIEKAGDALKIRSGNAVALNLQQAAKDMPAAYSALTNGNFIEASNICARYTTDRQFADLTKEIKRQSTEFETGNNQFQRGEYAFIQDWKTNDFAKHSPFAGLLANATNEYATLTTLQSQTSNAANWSKVKQGLDNVQPPASQKPPFKELALWVDNNNPINVLDSRLNFLMAACGLRSGVMDPRTGKPVTKMQRGIDKQPYQNLKEALDQAFRKANALTPSRSKDLEDIQRFLDLL